MELEKVLLCTGSESCKPDVCVRFSSFLVVVRSRFNLGLVLGAPSL